MRKSENQLPDDVKKRLVKLIETYRKINRNENKGTDPVSKTDKK